MIGLPSLARRYRLSGVGSHETAHAIVLHAANQLDHLIPDGSGKSLVMTHLDQVAYWADAALDGRGALNGGPPERRRERFRDHWG